MVDPNQLDQDIQEFVDAQSDKLLTTVKGQSKTYGQVRKYLYSHRGKPSEAKDRVLVTAMSVREAIYSLALDKLYQEWQEMPVRGDNDE